MHFWALSQNTPQQKPITYMIFEEDALMWRLVRGNVLRFPKMFKDSHVWLQIVPENQMLWGICIPPLNPPQ